LSYSLEDEKVVETVFSVSRGRTTTIRKIAMTSYTASKMGQLLDIVGASNPDPKARGPVVVEVRLWDGRIVSASYYNGPKFQKPDAESIYDIFYDVDPLVPLVDRLLQTGETFVTITGDDDMVCCLEWKITAGN